MFHEITYGIPINTKPGFQYWQPLANLLDRYEPNDDLPRPYAEPWWIEVEVLETLIWL